MASFTLLSNYLYPVKMYISSTREVTLNFEGRRDYRRHDKVSVFICFHPFHGMSTFRSGKIKRREVKPVWRLILRCAPSIPKPNTTKKRTRLLFQELSQPLNISVLSLLMAVVSTWNVMMSHFLATGAQVRCLLCWHKSGFRLQLFS